MALHKIISTTVPPGELRARFRIAADANGGQRPIIVSALRADEITALLRLHHNNRLCMLPADRYPEPRRFFRPVERGFIANELHNPLPEPSKDAKGIRGCIVTHIDTTGARP